jgi:uncharacterized SAM-binding protein YcdF (DUF218 family)
MVRGLFFFLSALGLLLLIVTFTPAVKWWARALSGTWNDPKGDVLIVLGGDVIDRNTLGYGSYWRAIYASRDYHLERFQTVLVTGQTVAGLMDDFLVTHGVPASVILEETAAHSTRENALFSKPILDKLAGRKILLTSDYHMFRARRCFEKAGIHVVPSPFPDALKRANRLENRWNVFLDLTLETAKIGYYGVRGWI